MRIVLLRGNDAHHRYLSALLRIRFHVVAEVVEDGAVHRRRAWTRRRWTDWLACVYHQLRRDVTGLNAYRRRAFAIPADWPAPAPCPTLPVGCVNHPDVAALLRRAGPDVTVVIGTSILGRDVLEAAGGMVINVHGGYLPDYRGNHCFFFALADGAFDRIGSTLHFADAGIDTGDLIETIVPALRPDDDAERLYCRAEWMAIHRLMDWLAHLRRGGTLPRRPQGMRGRLCRTRDRGPRDDLRMWFRRRTGGLRIPARPAPPLPPIPAPTDVFAPAAD